MVLWTYQGESYQKQYVIFVKNVQNIIIFEFSSIKTADRLFLVRSEQISSFPHKIQHFLLFMVYIYILAYMKTLIWKGFPRKT